MPRTALETGKLLRRRITAENAASPIELAGNRLMSGASTIALGGSIAAVVTYYAQPPEALHAHVVAIVIFLWQSLVFGMGKYLNS